MAEQVKRRYQPCHIESILICDRAVQLEISSCDCQALGNSVELVDFRTQGTRLGSK